MKQIAIGFLSCVLVFSIVSCDSTLSNSADTSDYDFVYSVINKTTGKLTVSSYIRNTKIADFSKGILANTEDVVIAIGESYQFKYNLSELIEKYSDEGITIGCYFFPEGKWRCGGWENTLDKKNMKHTVTVTDSNTACMNAETTWSDLN